MTETLTLSPEVIESYDILETGVLIIDRNHRIIYCNPWIRERLPRNLANLENLEQIKEHYTYSSVLSRIGQAFIDLQPVTLSPVLHKFIIPLFELQDSDSLMRQQGIIKPVLIETPPEEDKKLCAFIQIINVSNMIYQLRELEKAISDRKTAETKARVAMQQADAANKAKSEFLASMSHELRTPLNAIIGFTEILEAKLSNTLDEKQLLFFSRIKESGDHLLEMVNDILDLSKIEANKIEIDRKPFDFSKMLKGASNIIQSQALKKEIQIELDIQPDLGWLNGDEKRLKQVIYNLLSNAIKFSEPGSRIGIDAQTEEGDFHVTVWDEGIGISPEHLESIFEPFEQEHREMSPESGTGLGLSISKKLVELHQGRITVVSNPEQGSRFSLKLPGRIVKEEPSDEVTIRPGSAGDAPSAKDLYILVTEDNDFNREMMAEILENFRLDFAETGEEAVRMASENSYNLILMDVQLPGISGIEAMQQIRQNLENPPPIIALTALAMIGDQEKLITEGFDSYVPKPFKLDMLFNAIHVATNRIADLS